MKTEGRSVFCSQIASMIASTFNIRSVRSEEWQALQAIALYTFRITYEHKNPKDDFEAYIEEAFNDVQIQKELTEKNSFFYFLEEGEKIIGYLKLNIESAETEEIEGDTLEIERIYVLPEAQGKGYGKVLIQKAVSVAQIHQKNIVWLGVWDQNPEAIAFYERMGFRIFGTHIFRVGWEDQTDYLMKKIIE